MPGSGGYASSGFNVTDTYDKNNNLTSCTGTPTDASMQYLYSLLYDKKGGYSKDWKDLTSNSPNLSGDSSSSVTGLSELARFVETARNNSYGVALFGHNISGADLIKLTMDGVNIEPNTRISEADLTTIYDNAYNASGEAGEMFTDPLDYLNTKAQSYAFGDFLITLTNWRFLVLFLPLLLIIFIAVRVAGRTPEGIRKFTKRMGTVNRAYFALKAKIWPSNKPALVNKENLIKKYNVFMAMEAMPAFAEIPDAMVDEDSSLRSKKALEAKRDDAIKAQLGLLFTGGEIKDLRKYEKAGEISFENKFKRIEGFEYEETEKAAPANKFATDIYNKVSGASMHLKYDKAYGKNPDYIALMHIIDNGLIPREHLVDLFGKGVRDADNPGAYFNETNFVVYDDATGVETPIPDEDLIDGLALHYFRIYAVNRVEGNLLDELKNTVDITKQKTIDAFIANLAKCPPAPGVLFLKHVINESLLGFDQATTLSELQGLITDDLLETLETGVSSYQNYNFDLYITKVIEEKILTPELLRVIAALPVELTGATTAEGFSLRELCGDAAIDSVREKLIANPYLITKTALNVFDVKFSPFDKTREADNFEEMVLKKFLSMPITYSKKNSFGYISFVHQLVAYTSRNIKSLIPGAADPAVKDEIKRRISEMTRLFDALIPYELNLSKAITQRPGYIEPIGNLKNRFHEDDAGFFFNFLQVLEGKARPYGAGGKYTSEDLDIFNMSRTDFENLFPKLNEILGDKVVINDTGNVDVIAFITENAIDETTATITKDAISGAIKDDTYHIASYALPKRISALFGEHAFEDMTRGLVKTWHKWFWKSLEWLSGLAFGFSALVGISAITIPGLPILAVALMSGISFIVLIVSFVATKVVTATRELYWKKIIRPLLGFEQIWKIKTAGGYIKWAVWTAFFGFIAVSFLFPAAGLIPFVISAVHSAALTSFLTSQGVAALFPFIGMFSAVEMVIMPKLIVGKADRMKGFFTLISTLFAIYFGGFLGGFFVSGIQFTLPLITQTLLSAFASPVTIVISALVLFLIALPTFTSFWHLGLAAKSYSASREKTWSKEYKASLSRGGVGTLGLVGIGLGTLSLLAPLVQSGIGIVFAGVFGPWVLGLMIAGALLAIVLGLAGALMPNGPSKAKTAVKAGLAFAGLGFSQALIAFWPAYDLRFCSRNNRGFSFNRGGGPDPLYRYRRGEFLPLF